MLGRSRPFRFSFALTFCGMSLLIFLGLAVSTTLLARDSFRTLTASLKPVPVRARNGRRNG